MENIWKPMLRQYSRFLQILRKIKKLSRRTTDRNKICGRKVVHKRKITSDKKKAHVIVKLIHSTLRSESIKYSRRPFDGFSPTSASIGGVLSNCFFFFFNECIYVR